MHAYRCAVSRYLQLTAYWRLRPSALYTYVDCIFHTSTVWSVRVWIVCSVNGLSHWWREKLKSIQCKHYVHGPWWLWFVVLCVCLRGQRSISADLPPTLSANGTVPPGQTTNCIRVEWEQCSHYKRSLSIKSLSQVQNSVLKRYSPAYICFQRPTVYMFQRSPVYENKVIE